MSNRDAWIGPKLRFNNFYIDIGVFGSIKKVLQSNTNFTVLYAMHGYPSKD